MQIGIIGAGAAGLVAAIRAHQMGATVHLFDANTDPGRKLRATGSGRCNISNREAKAASYFSDDRKSLQHCFERLPANTVLAYLASLGIPTTSSEDGWIYPLSYSAANVAGILQDHISGIELTPNALITRIQKTNSAFLVSTAEKTFAPAFDALIIACGSPANPQLGARDALSSPIRELGHSFIDSRPALTPLETDSRTFHKLQGVRLDVEIELFHHSNSIIRNTGNIIFTKWGLNGPGVMDVSHLISAQDVASYSLRIDFLPHHHQDLKNNLIDEKRAELTLLSQLNAFLPDKASNFLLQQANLKPASISRDLSTEQRARLLKTIQNQNVSVRGVRGFQHAQASSGGVPLAEIKPDSMESRICSRLFFAGEIVNVLGPCGGYNLHWALLSGLIAAEGALLPSK